MFEDFQVPEINTAQLRKQDAYKYLNQQQFKAATYPLKSFLVLAGAGSGKTSVLIKRLRFLVESLELKGDEIMAVTFTNKAAEEIRKRAYGELTPIRKGNEVERMSIGTFHSICLKMMKQLDKYMPLNAKQSEIIDEDSRELLILRLLVDGYTYSPDKAQDFLTPFLRFNQLHNRAKIIYSESESKLDKKQNYALTQAISNLSCLAELAKGEKKSGKFKLPLGECNLNLVKGILAIIGGFKESGYRSSDIKEVKAFSKYFEVYEINEHKLPMIVTRPMTEEEILTYLALYLYSDYERYLLDNNMLDFSDLILSVVEALVNHQEARELIRNRYKVIMVDEFQDTNTVQYKWLKLITSDQTSVMVVGDDDQSIYGWRGAHVEYMRYFLTDFNLPLASGLEEPTLDYYIERRDRVGEVEMIKLEQNYRSTGHILSVANRAIKLNENRLDKTLFTKKDLNIAEKVKMISFTTSEMQAGWIIKDIMEQIHRSKDSDMPLSFKDFAILYRNNVSSAKLEQALTANNLPYIIYGGFNFYRRTEIREALTWLNFALNPNNDVHFDSVMKQVPLTKRRNIAALSVGESRGFKPKMVEEVKKEAKRTGASYLVSLCNIANRFKDELNGEISPNSVMRKGIYAEFTNDKTMYEIGQSCLDFAKFLAYVFEPLKTAKNFAEAVESILKRNQNLEYYKSLMDELKAKEKGERDTSRKTTNANKIGDCERYIKNVEVLIDSAFTEMQDSGEKYQDLTVAEQLRDWLQELALLTDKENASKTERITLMTTHSAKGLEFERVYLVDLNNKTFPSERGDEEEERRLYYVAVTRAKEELVICSSAAYLSKYFEQTLRYTENIEDLGVRTGEMVENTKFFRNQEGMYELRTPYLTERYELSKIAESDKKVLEKRLTGGGKHIPFENFFNQSKGGENAPKNTGWQGTRKSGAGASLNDIFDSLSK